MKPSLILAIDPGTSGAAVLRSGSGTLYAVMPYKGDETILEAVTWAAMHSAGPAAVLCVIEKVWASPVMGRASAFAFGANYGGWRLAAKQAHLRVAGVTPQAWQKIVAPDVEGQGKERKHGLLEIAKARFQGDHVTLATCDALLLSEYARLCIDADKPVGEPL